MNRKSGLLFTAVLGIWAIPTMIRNGAAVHAFRAIDQRSGLFAPHGARLYARFAPRILAGLYERATRDVEALVGRQREPIIVDLGSGPGELALALAQRVPAARVVGVDPAAAMRDLAAARAAASDLANVSFVAGHAEDVPLAEGTAHIVVSTLSMHHWPDPASAFAEIARILRPDGEARIYDARFAAYSTSELRRFAVRAGLDPEAITREVLPGRIVRPYVMVMLRLSGLARDPQATAPATVCVPAAEPPGVTAPSGAAQDGASQERNGR
jgi:SAM-dependent methyltransferase